MIFQEIVTWLNFTACLLIFIRLMTYRRKSTHYRPIASFVAYFLMIACVGVMVRTCTGHYSDADWGETLINIFLCIMLFMAKGNIMTLLKEGVRNV
ncbi:phage holin family protein [Pseudescherichia vulneris]